ncbi:hypothetical protein NDA07_11010 [Microcoleus vaginatus DQ-U2]|uniref:hypothetical protein n=1 Tax=Microcoleus vaginatus TaxID=119532 RepID=UPI001683364E|nr:hypothetical protein [Microcoleus sp. FACHB-DQ6]
MRLQSFLEAPEPSRAEERSQYSIPNTWKLSVKRSLFISVRSHLRVSILIVIPRVRSLERAIALLKFLRLEIEQLAVIDTPIDYCTASDCLRAALNAKWLRFRAREC